MQLHYHEQVLQFIKILYVIIQVEMEDFDANIEDQKEDKKDADEEESELVGNTSAAQSNKYLFFQGSNRNCVCADSSPHHCYIQHSRSIGYVRLT